MALALRGAPELWRNCLDRELPGYPPEELDLPLDEVLENTWLYAQHGRWCLSVGDELKALVDLDADEDADQIIATLESHPAVDEAEHADREVYLLLVSAPLTLEEAAALCVRALVAGHAEALRAAGLG
ncbi:MAG: hypothetical protein ACTHOD_13985 [Motilibacteraceae bacterium]